jgi:cytochrome c oxidase subunit 3
MSASAHGETEQPSWVAHYFHDANQQFSAAKFGMWLFIAQEILFFSGLFMAYIVFRWMYPETWLAGADQLNKWLGGLNTLVLITSSFTMALGVRYAQLRDIKKLKLNIALTIFFAGVFLVVKYFEYTHKFHLGIYPGKFYTYEGATGLMPIFFSIYYCITGLHAIHIVAGMIALAWIYWRAVKGDYDTGNYISVDNVGIYWHLVDLIWIFLFPLLYLVK